MKKVIRLFMKIMPIVLGSLQVNAQTADKAVQRYEYELTFQPDSSDAAQKQKENFYLDVLPEASRFVSVGKLIADFKMDSIKNAMEQSAASGSTVTVSGFSINLGGSPRGKFAYVIMKEPGGNMYYQEKVRTNDYYYKEDNLDFNWQIKEDVVDYHGMKCQVATTQYGGRSWTAYFTAAIPLNDGPYKFRGLPGLIVKMADAENHYVFEMIGSKKEQVSFALKPGNKTELVKKADFLKIKQNAATAPILAGIPADAKVMFKSKDGKELNVEDMQKQMAERAKKNNNPIERSL